MDAHRLIAEVKQRPALWELTHPDRSNRTETQRLWLEVADALGMTVDMCRTKWKNLRCSHRRLSRRSGLKYQPHHHHSPGHQWLYADDMSFLDGHYMPQDSGTNDEEDMPDPELAPDSMMIFKDEKDQMEADNDALMQEFQNAATPQALRRLSQSISLASAAAEEQLSPDSQELRQGMGLAGNPNSGQGSALAAAAASICHCAKRVDEQVNFLQNLEREEQQLMQSTSQDLARSKNVIHVGDSDYNYLMSFLPLMKQMTRLQNLRFRAKMGELLLQTMQEQHQQNQQEMMQQQQQQQQQQEQPSQMLLNQQQMALDQAQVSTSSTNWG
ncbi:hypothetical protein KR026_011196 [Drosophila bipectinata]|nr:hypothetical protein KR026_011196 [Drosophila bipectinata]